MKSQRKLSFKYKILYTVKISKKHCSQKHIFLVTVQLVLTRVVYFIKSIESIGFQATDWHSVANAAVNNY